MNCMIVEDEKPAVKVLENHLQHFPILKLVSIQHHAMGAMVELQRQKIDLLFLDIHLPQMNGLQLLQNLSNTPAVILTTAHRGFALEAFDYEVYDYLLKPIALDRFSMAIGKVFKAYQRKFFSTKEAQNSQ